MSTDFRGSTEEVEDEEQVQLNEEEEEEEELCDQRGDEEEEERERLGVNPSRHEVDDDGGANMANSLSLSLRL